MGIGIKAVIYAILKQEPLMEYTEILSLYIYSLYCIIYYIYPTARKVSPEVTPQKNTYAKGKYIYPNLRWPYKSKMYIKKKYFCC
jgi:hypothetical protein